MSTSRPTICISAVSKELHGIRDLRDDPARLRRRGKPLATLLLALFGLAIGDIGTTVGKEAGDGKKPAGIDEQGPKIQAALQALPAAMSEAKQNAPEESGAIRSVRAYESLEKSMQLPPGTLSKELPALSQRLLQRADTPELDKARAFFALKKHADAEASALRARDAALAATPVSIPDAIAALRLAGQSASEQNQYPRALEHCRAAAAHTSEKSDILVWAAIQNEIGCLLCFDGECHAQATLMHRVWQALENAGLSEHPAALVARDRRALALSYQGKYAEEEQEFRAVLAIRNRVLGPEHPDTLQNRMNLADALYAIGKPSAAEEERRAVLAIRERVLGPEHPDTLTSRNTLASTLYYRRIYAEAEREYRAVLAIRERVLGPEHPDTVASRSNLAVALGALRDYAKLEAEHRARIAIEERVLGPEHPGTLNSRNNLGVALACKGRLAEAEREHRAVLAIRDRVFGPEHHDTLNSCLNLSRTLKNLGRKAEALDLARRALAGRNKVLGEDHPHSQRAKQQVQDLEKE